MQPKLSLPIDAYLDQIQSLWSQHPTLIVKATPGSGKTTRLPWKIAQHSPKKVVVLEPRRLAAKLAAARIASEEGLTLGGEVGHHFRFDKNHHSGTKLIFYTEGTFLRLLLQQKETADIGTVILDEFHERHIETDLALAAVRTLQKERPDLKVILMSATLDDKLLQDFPGARLIEISSRQYDVKLHYLPNQPSVLNLALETKVKNTIRNLAPDSGDILVFLPGMREMMKVQDHLGSEWGQVFLLHAELSKQEQEEALSPHSRRKIILATNIAESSVTIPGIKVVIDSGIQREAHYSPWTGLKTLEDRPITQSSAIQRAGRAGRTSHGECWRLYAEQDYLAREAFTVPEILKADLTDTYLLAGQLSSKLIWFTPPPPERWQKAQELLFKLGAVTEGGSLTPVGQEMLSLPLGARLARVLMAGEKFTRGEKRRLLNFLCESLEKDSSGTLARRLAFYLRDEGPSKGPWEKALLSGFVDQVAKYRKKQNDFIHYSGKTLKAHSSLRELHHDFYLVLDVTPRLEAFLIVPIEEEWLYELEPFPFNEEDVLEVTERFQLRRETRIGSIPLEETQLPLQWERLDQRLKDKILLSGESPFRKRWNEFQEDASLLRLRFWARFHQHSWEELEGSLGLKNYLDEYGELGWEHLATYFISHLEKALAVPSLNEYLPLKINLGGNRDLEVHYPYGMDPFVEAPIQDFYGVTETPSIMKGKVPLSLKLLGPHKRPIQVTRDIKGFWKKTYQEMKREWQREYPRHHWPETPETAKPILLKRQLGD